MIVIIGITSFYFGSQSTTKSLINIPSKCYTPLQPSIYFEAIKSPIVTNTLMKTMIISFDTEDFGYAQISDTGSMRPTIPDKGTIIFIKPNIKEVQIGDIIGFKCGCKEILHRIINFTEYGYLTKGDNNDLDDFKAFGCKTKFEDINYRVVGILS